MKGKRRAEKRGGGGEKEAAGCHVESSSASDFRLNDTASETSLSLFSFSLSLVSDVKHGENDASCL